MSLNHDKIENLHVAGDKQIGRCPACNEQGHDKAGNHLLVNADGSFGCIQFSGDSGVEHRKRIYEIAGDKSKTMHCQLVTNTPEKKTDDQSKTISATYNYTDTTGNLLFQVVRYTPKDFRQRRADGKGGWIWKMKDVERVLYRLPKVNEAKQAGKVIFIAEGEKDVEALEQLELTATCNAGGAGKWQDSYSDTLSGAQVIIIADKDEAGRKHAELIAGKLQGKAKYVRVIELPDRNGQKVKDAADWIQAGGTRDELRELVKAADVRTPAAQTQITVREDRHIILPSGAVSISDSARQIFSLIAPTQTVFFRGGCVMELQRQDDGSLCLAVVKPEAFRSRLERFGKVFKWIQHKGNHVLSPSQCSTDTGKALLATKEADEMLPHVVSICNCPVIVETENGIKVLSKGYHPERGGILIVDGDEPDEISLETGIEKLNTLLCEFDFTSPGDRSRAIASFITPALRMGGFITDNIPIDVSEADQSQAGKTLRQKITCAIYNEAPYIVAQRQGGVGSADESLSQALVAGRPFIQLDNIRGRLDSQFLEAFLTAGGLIGARIPRVAEIQIDSRFFVLLMTSNGVETTRDLANRASIVRIKKQKEGYQFRQYPEGGVVEHVRGNQSHYLASVFAVVRFWIEQGKQKTNECRHDFRQWAQILDWIVQNAFHEAPLMDGHQVAQERVSNPALTWLRKVALAVVQDNCLNEPLSASAIGDTCENHGIDIPGLKDLTDEDQRKRKIGVLMGRVFRESEEQKLDGFTVSRSEIEQERTGGGTYQSKTYIFTKPAQRTDRTETPYRIEKDTFSTSIVPSMQSVRSTAEITAEDLFRPFFDDQDRCSPAVSRCSSVVGGEA